MNDYLAFGIGVGCAAAGGEWFVRGAVGLAHWARVPPAIIGATIAAFATSSPELAVSLSAAADGKPQIALGDALGSNIVNIALVLAIAILIAPLGAPRAQIRRDYLIALMAPLFLAVLTFDGNVSRFDAALLLGVFVLWLRANFLEAKRVRNADTSELEGEVTGPRTILLTLAGLVLLVLAGRFIVTGAKAIALAWGMNEFLVGATVVALATSTPGGIL